MWTLPAAAGTGSRRGSPVIATFSIVAYDAATGDLGVGVTSKFPAVGSGVPWAKAGVGAVATQAAANLSFGQEGLELMARGLSAQAALQKVVNADAGREDRQVGMVDAKGRAATFTGKNCFSWAGGKIGEHFAVQGNILVGPDTVDAMAKAFETSKGELPDRLLVALEAGQAAGGDRRGRESAALLVVRKGAGYGGKGDRWVDLRVDDHPEPLRELRRLVGIHHLYFGRTDRSRVHTIDSELARELQQMLAKRGFYKGPINGKYDAATRKALEDYMGWENLEERIQKDDTLDDVVLRYIREHEK
ncbi:MAG: DUF1028 domain-containing protein [Acidobacteria bacterium]|nr:DUF1028 domain-containing protein [Acidobacteriota bacterium]MCI0566904.1 DUF1028 domain-containing protein [Acidobacteriota bacterium]